MKTSQYILIAAFVLPVAVSAQNRYPTVASIIRQHDADKDGSLSAKEVRGSRYARQFPRWDTDKNGRVSSQEIIAFRKRFGIAADGSMLNAKPKALAIPKIHQLPRIDSTQRPTAQAARNSAFLLKTRKHAVTGSGYVIITDHQDATYEKALQQLKAHHSATILRVPNLASWHSDAAAIAKLRNKLRDIKPKYVAIAPRLQSFHENMLLGMWELLSTLDEDPYLDALPGILVASNSKSFARLIDQSTSTSSVVKDQLRPLAISQVQRAAETRSLQKAGILRDYFAGAGYQTPIVAIYGNGANSAPRLAGKQVWNLTLPGPRKFVEQFPEDAAKAITQSNLIIMHGHGIPGMSCSVDLKGLPADLSGKILLAGSCFSAAPDKSVLGAMRQAPGGYEVKKRDAFVIRAIDQGSRGCLRPPTIELWFSPSVSRAGELAQRRHRRRRLPTADQRVD